MAAPSRMLWDAFAPSQTNPPLYASARALAMLQTVDVSGNAIPTKNVRKSFKNAAFPLTNTAFWHRFSLANFGVREVFDGTRVGLVVQVQRRIDGNCHWCIRFP